MPTSLPPFPEDIDASLPGRKKLKGPKLLMLRPLAIVVTAILFIVVLLVVGSFFGIKPHQQATQTSPNESTTP